MWFLGIPYYSIIVNVDRIFWIIRQLKDLVVIVTLWRFLFYFFLQEKGLTGTLTLFLSDSPESSLPDFINLCHSTYWLTNLFNITLIHISARNFNILSIWLNCVYFGLSDQIWAVILALSEKFLISLFFLKGSFLFWFHNWFFALDIWLQTVLPLL